MNMNYSSAIKCVNAIVKLGGIQVGSGKQVNYSGSYIEAVFGHLPYGNWMLLATAFPITAKWLNYTIWHRKVQNVGWLVDINFKKHCEHTIQIFTGSFSTTFFMPDFSL